jgi:hypothetical protein
MEQYVATDRGNESDKVEQPLSVSEAMEVAALVAIKEGFGPNSENCSIETTAMQVVIHLSDRHTLKHVVVILGLGKARRLLRLAHWLDSLTW